MEEKNLIVVKQLPIIEEKLQLLSHEIDKRVEKAKNLVATDDGVKELKKYRAENNNDFKLLETQRKRVKEQIEKPYKDFETIYKSYISDKFSEADKILKGKIDEFENTLKAEKETAAKKYFEEYKEFKQIDFVDFEAMNLNITLSVSEKALNKQSKEFLDKISDDLLLIETQDHKEEVLVEYKKTLNVSSAITTVVNRYRELEAIRAKKEEAKEIATNKTEMIKKVEEEIHAPVAEPIEEPVEALLKVNFTVIDTRERLKELVNFMKERGYKYEQQ